MRWLQQIVAVAPTRYILLSFATPATAASGAVLWDVVGASKQAQLLYYATTHGLQQILAVARARYISLLSAAPATAVSGALLWDVVGTSKLSFTFANVS